MTIKQLEARVAKLEQELATLQQKAKPKKEGWRALVGIATDDPVMKEAMSLAMKYREDDRRKARRKPRKKAAAK